MTRHWITFGLSLALSTSAFAQSAQELVQRAQNLAQQARAAYPRDAWNIDRPLFKQAAEAAEQAVQAAPSDPTALKLRAQIYTDARFWARAEVSWNAYLQTNNADAEARRAAAEVQYNLGFAAYRREQLDVARQAFTLCLEYNPDARCAAWGGRVELESGQSARAVPLYEQAVRLAPNDQSNQYFLGVARRASTFGAEATSAFSRGYRAFEAGNRQAALNEFQQATRLAPQFTDAQRFVGRLALELGQGAVARQAWEAVSAQPGASAADKFNLDFAREVEQFGLEAVRAFRAAYTQYTGGNKAAAEQGFESATQQSPTYQKAWAWLGRTRFEQNNFTGAAQAYQVAVQLDPNDKSSAYFLTQAQRRQ
ncbi:tetratricopeptide repeat protein [Deinococcus peraridilitoris]|uniref:Tetratricopeptide repeat protein n=1 Tax=Deinococcus peraridilitoris (strain DSM 19664 / LMG 22246 / CIP 109416 / KR-200) TaxID=937777 RepID=L0A4C5_DEIPD|nr:tetratricopeptide repeat protein [Deinococcus peraridilitoris]AFZ68032.1 hypothetical protein Deipe_2567 [Deinococcus peraridilitoris DSM 19664]